MDYLSKQAAAYAIIKGSSKYKGINGIVKFYNTTDGIYVATSLLGLPDSPERCAGNVYGCHIHEGGSCSGNGTDPFADTLGHYNPGRCPHPAHAGDMPPIFGNRGRGYTAFVTSRFSIDDIIGKTVIVHSAADDFTSQPSGNSGEKIACGVIVRS